jgi:hypothetical protein
MILAIDPGPEQSAAVWWDGERVVEAATFTNHELLNWMDGFESGDMVIEMVASYGMAVGASVFETVFWTGRFYEAWNGKAHRLYRKDVKMHLCGNNAAKDSNIIQALKDRFGDKPTKKRPNPVYGDIKLSGDQWQSFALAVVWWDQNKSKTGMPWSGYIPE